MRTAEHSEALIRGMAAQLQGLRAALFAGMPRVGWKVGLNFPEAQAKLSLTEPTVGWLHGNRLLPNAAIYAPSPGSRLHVEAEVCLRVCRAVPAGVSTSEGRAAISEIAPSIELVNYARSWSGLEVVVSHSMFHEATVLGSFVSPQAWPDLGFSTPRVLVNRELRAEARVGLVPPDLGAVVAFVAGYLARFGEVLCEGDLILSGSYTNPVPVTLGAEVLAEFGDLGQVSVTVAPDVVGADSQPSTVERPL